MGLAATQARFLLLTSRQSDVEQRMMSISNQKLALARESAALAAQHTRAMGAQNVMWTTGSGTNAKETELQYSDVMSVSNGNYLTNAYGALVLDSNMLSKLGLDGSSGAGSDFTAKYDTLEKFLTKMLPADKLTETITTKDADGNEQLVIGEDGKVQTRLDKLLADVAESDNKAAEIANDPTKQDVKFVTYYNDSDVIFIAEAKSKLDYTGREALFSNNLTGSETEIYNKINGVNNKNDFTNMMNKASSIVTNITKTLSEAMVIHLTEQKGYGDYSAEIAEALAWAEKATLDKFYNQYDSKDTSTDSNKAFLSDTDAMEKSKHTESDTHIQGRSNFIDVATWQKGMYKKEGNAYINRDQVTKTFLSYFDAYCEEHFSSTDDVNITSIGKENSTYNANNDYTLYGDMNSITRTERDPDFKPVTITPSVGASYTVYQKTIQGSVPGFSTTVTASSYPTGSVPGRGPNIGWVNNTYYYRINIETGATISESEYQQLRAQNNIGYGAGKSAPEVNAVYTTTSIRGAGHGGTADTEDYANKYAHGAVSDDGLTGATYYVNMYKQLSNYGWVTNNNIKNSDYLQQQVLYGNVQIKSVTGYSTSSTLSVNDTDNQLSVQDDEDAIEKENNRYERLMKELEFKETLLDKMQEDLDSEREAINTEKESVQKIIDNNVKTFKLFG